VGRALKDLVITVSGHHGSGRSTNAKHLAEKLGLRYISSGILFRERANELAISLEEMNIRAGEEPSFDNWLDERTKIESRKRGVVIDANLSAWMAENPDIRIFVTCPFDIRIKRIAEREGRNIVDVEKETRIREDSERKRYLEYYGIDILDLSVYDIILNTSMFTIEGNSRILKFIVDEYITGG
jgi:cytidylate kinase